MGQRRAHGRAWSPPRPLRLARTFCKPSIVHSARPRRHPGVGQTAAFRQQLSRSPLPLCGTSPLGWGACQPVQGTLQQQKTVISVPHHTAPLPNAKRGGCFCDLRLDYICYNSTFYGPENIKFDRKFRFSRMSKAKLPVNTFVFFWSDLRGPLEKNETAHMEPNIFFCSVKPFEFSISYFRCRDFAKSGCIFCFEKEVS